MLIDESTLSRIQLPEPSPPAPSGGDLGIDAGGGPHTDADCDRLSPMKLPMIASAELQRLLRQFRAELVRELAPQTFLEKQSVASLAADLVQRNQIDAMIEGLYAAQLTPELHAEHLKYVKAQEEVEQIEAIHVPLMSHRPLDCDPAMAASFARQLARFVKGVEEELAELRQELETLTAEVAADSAAESDDDWMGKLREQIEELEAWQAVVEPVRAKLGDETYLEPVLQGTRPLTEILREAMSRILNDWLMRARIARDAWASAQRRVEQIVREQVAGLAASPEELLILQHQKHKLEQVIEKKLRHLRRRRRR